MIIAAISLPRLPNLTPKIMSKMTTNFTSDQLQIQSFSVAYADEVCRLILSIQREEFGLPVTLEGQADLLNIPDFYQRANGNFWIALVNDHVVGTIALLDIGNAQAALRKMFVASECRGQHLGVAATLLRTCLNWAASKQTREVFLGTTLQFLAAHRFYEKHGFTEIDRRILPSTFPIMSVDTKFYRQTMVWE